MTGASGGVFTRNVIKSSAISPVVSVAVREISVLLS